MQREEFNNLSIDKQVDYFINEIRKGSNFNAICKDIGISKNTIKARFQKEGYQEVKKGQIIVGYIKQGKEIADNKAIEEVKINKPKKEKSRDNKANNINIDMILKRIEKLEEEIKEIKAPNSSNQVKDIINSFNGETVVKTFKIDKEVSNKLEEYLNNNSQYKKQDVVSSLLDYALSNIK